MTELIITIAVVGFFVCVELSFIGSYLLSIRDELHSIDGALRTRYYNG